MDQPSTHTDSDTRLHSGENTLHLWRSNGDGEEVAADGWPTDASAARLPFPAVVPLKPDRRRQLLNHAVAAAPVEVTHHRFRPPECHGLISTPTLTSAATCPARSGLHILFRNRSHCVFVKG